MKSTACVVLAGGLLSACAGNVQPYTFADGTPGRVTACGGAKSTWQECFDAARSACGSGYDVIEKEGFEHDGHIKRSLYFKCK